MNYLRFGNPCGEPFVILPGLSLKSVLINADGIRRAYAPLAARYEVILPDRVPEMPDGYTIAAMAADTLAALDALSLSRFHLMGVSMGGMIAQTLAASAPSRVRSLILCSTAMSASYANQAVLADWEAHAAAHDTAALMTSFGENVYTPAFFARFREVIAAAGAGATPLDFHNFLASLAALKTFDASALLPRVTCPALVLGAGEDRIFAENAATDLAGALHASCRIFEDFGHAAYDEAPDYLSVILAFLESLPPQNADNLL